MKKPIQSFHTFESFIQYITILQPYLLIDNFLNQLKEIFENNELFSNSSKQQFNNQIKKILKLQGKTISQTEYWVSRGWTNPAEKISYVQSIRIKNSPKKNPHKGSRSLEWFINKYGEHEGSKKHFDYHHARGKKCTDEYLKATKGEEYLIQKKKKHLCSLQGFIDRHGNEEGKIRFDQFRNKSRNTLEKFIRIHGEQEGPVKFAQYKRKLAEKSYRKFVLDGTYIPNKGKNETQILDKIEQEQNIILDRSFRVWRYHPDGYCHSTNTIYEVYEKYHLLNKQKIKDEKRISWLKNKLNCDVVIIWDL